MQLKRTYFEILFHNHKKILLLWISNLFFIKKVLEPSVLI